MAITLNTLAYAMDTALTPNKVRYVGPSQSTAIKDRLDLGRTDPKPSGTERGYARHEVKRTKTVTCDDAVKRDVIITVSTSIPVGAADADIDALRDDVGDFVISADCGNLLKKGKVNGL